jgi:EmrB/QacA subfamily drug resistance transporter
VTSEALDDSGALRVAGGLQTGTAAGRWVVAAAVLGSGVAFLDGSVVNAALPAIAADLHTDLAGLQWVLNGYLLMLGSFLVIGGSLGDRFGRRRVLLIGLAAFGAASLLCALAPTTVALVGARCLQGVAAALLVPGSLAIISASFRPEDRGAAIGAWSGLGGVASAVGPFLGGWLIDAVSWRAVFFVNLPLIAVAIVLTVWHVPESFDPDAGHAIDVAGAATLPLGLGGVVYALIEGPANGWGVPEVTTGALGIAALVAFVVIELRSPHPMIALGVFRSRQFSGANLTTFVVYGGIGVTFFLVVVYLQTRLGYSPLSAGASLLPITVFMLLFSARMGALAQRIGPRLPMTIGPVVVGAGIALFSGLEPGVSYWVGVLPPTVLLGIGLTITVAPLTATVLAAIEDRHAGLGSAVNNAVARIGTLLAIAVVPAAAGIAVGGSGVDLDQGFDTAMYLAGVLCVLGGVIAWCTIRVVVPVHVVTRADISIPCHPPCLELGVVKPGNGWSDDASSFECPQLPAPTSRRRSLGSSRFGTRRPA